MNRDRWENISGGILAFVIVMLWGAYLIYSDVWPFGWFWMLTYSIMGGLSYIVLMYPQLGDKDKFK